MLKILIGFQDQDHYRFFKALIRERKKRSAQTMRAPPW
jgi:hypothetical protein